MAYIVSTASGNWSNTATWAGGVVPGDGDTVEIAPNHQVTVTDARTIGTSPNNQTTIVLWVRSTSTSSGGRVTIADGGHLTVKGNIAADCTQTSGSAWHGVDVQGGGTLTFDASASGGTPGYGIMCGNALNARSGFRVAGTSDSKRGTVQAVVGHAWFVWPTAPSNTTYTYPDGSTGTRNPGTSGNTCDINWSWGNFIRGGTGNGTTTSLLYHVYLGGAAHMAIADSTFTSCGAIQPASPPTDRNITFDRLTWTNDSVGNTCLFMVGRGAGSGVRRVKNCVLRGQLAYRTSHANVTDEDNIIRIGTEASARNLPCVDQTTTGKLTSWQRNVFAQAASTTGNTMVSTCGDLTDSILLKLGSNGANPHWITLGVPNTVTFSGNYLEWANSTASAVSGDNPVTSGTTAVALTYRNNIHGIGPNGGMVGNWTHFGGNLKNCSYVVEHNTVLQGTWWLTYGETQGGDCDNVFTSVKSNLVAFRNTGSQRWKVKRETTGPGADGTKFADFVTDAVWVKNAVWQGDAGNIGLGCEDACLGNSPAEPMFTGSPPGTTSPDITSDPAMVGQGGGAFAGLRGAFLKWGQSINPALTTADQVLDEMAKMNLPTFDSRFTVSNALTYIRNLYRPTNTALKDAGHDGVTIGAVEGVWPSTGSSGEEWYYRRRARRLRQQRRAA